MVKPFSACLGLVILSCWIQPALSQTEAFIGLPPSPDPSTSAFARWQQTHQPSEAESDPELEGMVIKTQSATEPELSLGEEESGSFDQMMEMMQSLPVRVDYTGVGLIYERSY